VTPARSNDGPLPHLCGYPGHPAKPATNKPVPGKPSNDPFCSHKVALRPLLRPLDEQETTALFKTLESVEREEFVAFLYRQGLAQLWLEFLLAQDSLPNAFEAIIASLKQDAINTAAWASLTWLPMLTDEPAHADLARQLRPGGLRAGWLRYWLEKNLNVKLAKRKLVLRGGFSMALQDSLKDAARAIFILQKEQRTAAKTMQKLGQ